MSREGGPQSQLKRMVKKFGWTIVVVYSPERIEFKVRAPTGETENAIGSYWGHDSAGDMRRTLVVMTKRLRQRLDEKYGRNGWIGT